MSPLLWSAPDKNELAQSLLKVEETKLKINSLTPSDFTTYLTEINQIRIKIDEITDNILHLCNQNTDKNQTVECINNAKIKIKILWTAYFKSKEDYLNKLHDFFLSENSKQAKLTDQTLDAISATKNSR